MDKRQVPGWLTAAPAERLLIGTPPRDDVQRDRGQLDAIASGNEAEPRLRVLASELLADAGQPPDRSLAGVYARTLPDTFAHNLWGMPGEYVERLGRTLLSFGDAAIPGLLPLLDDKRPLGYFGSEEPTLNKKMGYRVSDLAAYFLSQLTGRPYAFAPEPSVRDEDIRRLKHALESTKRDSRPIR
jgi:hypothetical protein